MTEISFHFNVPDRVEYACRLLRKAWRRQAAIAVVADDDDALARVDHALWRIGAADFVAHARIELAAATPARLHATTVWLCREPDAVPAPHTLVNVGDAMPRGFESYARLIELVSTDDACRAAARERWKGYVRRGYAIERHEVTA